MNGKRADQLRREAERLRTTGSGPQPEEQKDPAQMTPEELDKAIEAQREEVRQAKERELQAAREATGGDTRTKSVIAGLNTASRRRRMFK